ncbi:hypothetical protein FSP39_021226 [Pinctada imbricata]|uniref:Uncharacterized protein n=1 Tax=Pinctada imbricata TaxID=66713 RepID=A0AA89BZW9_PINIB|nr:hypothetical protein FSP39_021226 [Pinctada imbricata]
MSFLHAVPTTTEGPPPDVSFLLYFLIIPAVIFVIWLILLIVVCLLICHRKYRNFFKHLRKHSKPKVHADKVWRSMLPRDKLSIIQSDHKHQFCFRPKRPIDLSVFDLTFETGSCPSIVPADKLSTLYPDPIEDYMRGKIPRYPSGLSLYSIDSVVFENRRSHIINWISPPQKESTMGDMTSSARSTSETTDVTSEGTD